MLFEMNKTLQPKLDILPPQQRRLWDKLGATPDEFVLYGGTALALRLGHRTSVDFDFFGNDDIDPQELLRTVSYLKDMEVQVIKENTLTGLVDGVQLSFFGLKDWQTVEKPEIAQSNGLQIASLIDLAGTKAMVVQCRNSWKDYVDLHAVLELTDLTLEDALAAGRLIYDKRFNPMLTLKALTYFEDISSKRLSKSVRLALVKAVKDVDIDAVESRLEFWRERGKKCKPNTSGENGQ